MTLPDPTSDPVATAAGSEFVFGTTREDAKSLVPLASLSDDHDAPFIGANPISSEMVDTWLRLVAGQVRARIAGFERITTPSRIEFIANAARAVVATGAAYWWEGARTQQRRDHSGGSYAQDLEDRYKAMLTDLAGTVGKWLPDLPEDPEVVRSPQIVSNFPPPVFGDGTRW